jgi:hypothetical protein
MLRLGLAPGQALPAEQMRQPDAKWLAKRTALHQRDVSIASA